jgi:PAS domain S-box-containing protein
MLFESFRGKMSEDADKKHRTVKSSSSQQAGAKKNASLLAGVSLVSLVMTALGTLVCLATAYFVLPKFVALGGHQNVMFAIIAVSLLLLSFAAIVIQHGQQKVKVLQRMNHNLGRKNRSLRDGVEHERFLKSGLQESEKKNREIIDSIKDVIFETDEDGRLIFLNLSWAKITGFEIEQSIGQSLFSVLYQDDQAEIKGEFEELLAGRKERYRAFTQLRRADGTFSAVEISISMIGKSLDGEVRFSGTITDIEERRRAERALAEAERKYRNIVQNAAGGIYQLTPEGLYLSANPALSNILGFSRPEKLLREVKNANESVYVDATAREAFIRKLEMSNEAVRQEVQMTRRDGSVIWVNENARAVRDETGRMLFIEGSIEDITERKESEIMIRDAKMQSDLANRAKSEFLSNMSHELRTPLNSIIGFSEMIKDEVFGPVGQKAYWEYAKDIFESGQGLLGVINEILDISKIEAGERQLNEGVVNVQAVIRDCLGLLEHKIDNNNLMVTASISNAPDVVGEELSIKQMLMNILSNAVKFTPDSGRITISTHIDADGRFNLSVSDTGVGLDEEGIRKALSPFGQVNSELSRSGSGTGLGLTLVDALIRLHGGDCELFSHKGIGTTATIIFPKNRIVVKADGTQTSSSDLLNQIDQA